MIDEIDESPFRFAWPVDQDGYSIDSVESDRLGQPSEVIRPRGGPYRFYRPLDDDGLWLRFGENCKSREDVLSFVTQFGPLTRPPRQNRTILGRQRLFGKSPIGSVRATAGRRRCFSTNTEFRVSRLALSETT